MNRLVKLQSYIDDQKDMIKEEIYINLCNIMKEEYRLHEESDKVVIQCEVMFPDYNKINDSIFIRQATKFFSVTRDVLQRYKKDIFRGCYPNIYAEGESVKFYYEGVECDNCDNIMENQIISISYSYTILKIIAVFERIEKCDNTPVLRPNDVNPSVIPISNVQGTQTMFDD